MRCRRGSQLPTPPPRRLSGGQYQSRAFPPNFGCRTSKSFPTRSTTEISNAEMPMRTPFQRKSGYDRGDEEASGNTGYVDVDFDDDQWVVDVNLQNIITKIKPHHKGLLDHLGHSWTGITRTATKERSLAENEEVIGRCVAHKTDKLLTTNRTRVI